MTALFDLASEYRESADKLADMEMDEQTIADTLEGMSGDLSTKATNIARLMRNLTVTAIAIKDAEAQMAARRKAITNRVDRLNDYLLGGMQYAGITRIESPQFVISIAKNPASVDVFEPALLPTDYFRFFEPPEPEPNKTAIKAAIQSGADVPGARLVQTNRLSIK